MHRPRVDSIDNGEISIESKMSAPLGLHLIVSIIVLKDAFSWYDICCTISDYLVTKIALLN